MKRFGTELVLAFTSSSLLSSSRRAWRGRAPAAACCEGDGGFASFDLRQ